MRRSLALALLLGAVVPRYALAGKPPPPPPPPSPSFAVTTAATKVGDFNSGGMYVPGSHALARNGSELYVAYVNHSAGNPELYVGRSVDGGASWPSTVFVASTPDIDSNGAVVAVGPDPGTTVGARLHVLWGDATHHVLQYSYTHVEPNYVGPFSTPVDVSGAVGANSYSYSIATDPLGGVHVAYLAWNGGSQNGIYYSRSDNGGTSFVETATLVIPYLPGGPCVAADSAGDVFVVANAWTGASYNELYSRKLAGGSWSPPVSLGTSGDNREDPSVTPVDANRIFVTWYELGTKTIVLSSTTTGGLTPSSWTLSPIASESYSAPAPNVAIDAAGVLSAVWNRGSEIVMSRSTNSGGTWIAPVRVATAPTGDLTKNVYGPSVAVDSNGKALVAFGAHGVFFTREQ